MCDKHSSSSDACWVLCHWVEESPLMRFPLILSSGKGLFVDGHQTSSVSEMERKGGGRGREYGEGREQGEGSR